MDKTFWLRLLQPDVVVFLVPIVAIISVAIVKIVKMVHAHNERITMIQHGMHPDYPPDNKDEG
ncbi:MAG: hypothetical protein ABSA26_03245 [Thermoguttaceae bacterium]|jgi:hypothetical protein